MTELIFATNNQHKVDEILSHLPIGFNIITLKSAGIDIEIEEPFNTLEENALQKAQVIYDLTGKSCFGEDTGLEIEALNGKPGVRSARYAGSRDADDNIKLVLEEMKDQSNRDAQFRTIICLMLVGKPHVFVGICKGTIIASYRGIEGFGYDPIFIPDGSDFTFAEMNMVEKNRFSHRRKALDKLIEFLNNTK